MVIETTGKPGIPFGFAKRYGVVVLDDSNQRTVLYRNGVAFQTLLEIQRSLGSIHNFKRLDDAEFQDTLTRVYEQHSETTLQHSHAIDDDLDLAHLVDTVSVTEDLLDQENDAPIIRLINALLTQAVKQNASDIHFEIFESRIVVRFRIDGILREILQPKRHLAQLLISRIKVMAKLDIAEKRLPQDGRISLLLGGRDVDVRVSTIPTRHGERAVLRILDKKAGRLDIARLGMDPRDQQKLLSVIAKPHGVVLVTGPTGSGKTTTLYAALNRLNDGRRNIMTVEDPVEYDLEGIAQTQVAHKSNMSFARGLRAILRQDPDIVMIGEIRDLETAEIAIQASLTGHLVLSTLHTNSPVGALTRLQDMGIQPYLLASSLLAVMGQRLVRVLCTQCRDLRPATAAELELMDSKGDTGIVCGHPTGCAACGDTGYRGRTGIYEFLVVEDQVRQMIHDQAGEQALLKIIREQSASMMADGWRLVKSGVTSIEEVLRVSHEL